MQAIAENNPILQKIIVFENCFDILLNIALSEGEFCGNFSIINFQLPDSMAKVSFWGVF